MQPRPGETLLRLGPALIRWRPPSPLVWRAWLLSSPGPASLCLNLLPLAEPRWERVVWRDGADALASQEASAALPLAALEPLLRGLCPPWLDQEQEGELAAMQRHLESRADFPGLGCDQCREQEELGEDPPDCRACPLAPAPASAGTALALLPWLDSPPWLLNDMLAGLRRDLPASAARLLDAQLLLLHRWRQGRAGRGDCPFSDGRDTF